MASDIGELYSKISAFLSRGPALTVDIAEYLGMDTTQTSAVLDYYVSKGDIGRTERRYGTSAIYYAKKDLDAAMNKLYQTLDGNEKSVVNKIKTAKVVKSDDLAPAERYLSKSLTDFIKMVSAKDSETGDTIGYLYYYQLTLNDVNAILNPTLSIKAGAAKTREGRQRKAGGTKKLEYLTPEIKNMLFGYGFSNVSRVGADTYYCDYGQNRLRVIVIVANKSSLTNRDFIKFAGYAESYKTICFVLSTAKKIADFSKYGSVINILKVN